MTTASRQRQKKNMIVNLLSPRFYNRDESKFTIFQSTHFLVESSLSDFTCLDLQHTHTHTHLVCSQTYTLLICAFTFMCEYTYIILTSHQEHFWTFEFSDHNILKLWKHKCVNTNVSVYKCLTNSIRFSCYCFFTLFFYKFVLHLWTGYLDINFPILICVDWPHKVVTQWCETNSQFSDLMEQVFQ